MTDVSSRPMPTPDLANLLKRPPRPAAETRSHAPNPPEPQVPPGDAATRSDAAEPRPPMTTTSEALGSASPGRAQSVSEQKRRRSSAAVEDDVVNQPPQTPTRQYLRIKSVYLPRSLHQRLGEYATAQKTTRTALILAAVNRTHSRLGSYLATGSGPSGSASGNDLFDIPQLKKDAEPAVQTTIRITDRQHQAIEALVAQLGTNRSQLVAAALRLYLGEDRTN